MWSNVLLDPLSFVPKPPVDLHARDANVSPGESAPQYLHRLNASCTDLNLLLAPGLYLYPCTNIGHSHEREHGLCTKMVLTNDLYFAPSQWGMVCRKGNGYEY